MHAPIVAVCGTSTASPAEAELAYTVGNLLAKEGVVVVCGGLTGVMTAVAEGSKAGGGTSIGFLPGTDVSEAAADLTFAIPTGMGEMRNALIIRSSSGIIAIGGGYGTLSEIGFALRLGRPVAALATWEVRRPGESEREKGVYYANSPGDAVQWVMAKVATRQG